MEVGYAKAVYSTLETALLLAISLALTQGNCG
jgi:hypothetical protein